MTRPRQMQLTAQICRQFDSALGEVLGHLPAELISLFDEIPLVVENQPSEQMLTKLQIDRPERLRGLHTGTPLTRRSVHHSGVLPTVITIYRLGICLAAAARDGRINPDVLKREIRKTVLHELGHYFGMTEADLRRHGYG